MKFQTTGFLSLVVRDPIAATEAIPQEYRLVAVVVLK
jgi:hypothetical protein